MMARRLFLPPLGWFCCAMLLVAGLVTAVWGGPATAGASAGAFPELIIVATDDDLIVPSRIEGGRYLVTIHNNATQAEAAPVIVRLPDGLSLDDLLAAPMNPATGISDWFYREVIIGGPIAPAKTTAQAILDFEPGRYAVFGEAFQPQRVIEVIDGDQEPAAPAEPPAETEILLGDGAITGVPAEVAAGRHVWRVTSAGVGPHRFQLFRYPEPATLDQFLAALALPEGATPPAGLPDLSRLEQLGGVAVTSSGRTVWAVLDLIPGTYVALCPIPDAETSTGHFTTGELAVFSVVGTPSANATPAA